MNGNKEDEFCFEYYRNLRERFTSQGNRLWTRFNYFLTIETAIVGAFILAPGGISARWRFVGLPIIGLCWSALWFWIAANDLWFYEERYKGLRRFEKDNLVSKVGIIPTRMVASDLPRWKRFVCFKTPKCGATTFSAIVPACFVLVWLVTTVVSWITER